jgi:hypothetical protein
MKPKNKMNISVQKEKKNYQSLNGQSLLKIKGGLSLIAVTNNSSCIPPPTQDNLCKTLD